MEKGKPRGDSNYAKRFARRKSQDGGSDKPLPKVLLGGHYPKYAPKLGNSYWVSNPPLPCENLKLLAKLRVPYVEKFRKEVTTQKKYNHEAMNYYGWDN